MCKFPGWKKGPKKSAERRLSTSYPGHLQLMETVNDAAGGGKKSMAGQVEEWVGEVSRHRQTLGSSCGCWRGLFSCKTIVFMFSFEQKFLGNKWLCNLELVEIRWLLIDQLLALQMNLVSDTHLCNQKLWKQVLDIQFGLNVRDLLLVFI